MRKLKLFSMLLLLLIGVGQMWATAVKDTISMQGYANGTSTSYVTTSTKGSSAKGVEVYSVQYIPNTGQVKGNQTAVGSQWSLYNSKPMPGAITSIEITQTADTTSNSNKFQNNLFVALGKVSKSSVTTTTANDSIIKGGYANKHKFIFSGIDASKAYTYFKIYSNEKFGSGTLRGVKVIVTYETSGGGSTEPTVSVKQGSTAIETLNVPATGATSQTLTLEYANIKANSEGATPSINFYSNAACTSASSQDWFSATGTNKTTVTYSAGTNNTGSTRTVYAVVSNTVKNTADADKTVRDTITISQASLVQVTNISVKASTSVEVEATETLTATVTPDNASDKSVTWSSDDEAIATVDENGKVTGVAVGTTNIKATANDGSGVYGSCAVTVKAALPKIIIDGEPLTSTATTQASTIKFGNAQKDSISVVLSDGAKYQTSTNATNHFGSQKSIFIGKADKYIYNSTPIPGNFKKFELYANYGASASVSVSVTFSRYPLNAAGTGSDTLYTATLSTLDNVYDCSAKIPEGAKYFYYKVTSAYNSQVQFRITYEPITSPVTITAPTTGTGLLAITNGTTPVASGDNIEAGTKLTITATPNATNHYIGGTIVVKDGENNDVTSQVLSGTTLTMPEYAITVSATFTPTYEITQSGSGGTIAWEANSESGNLPAYFAEGTEIVITANADNTHSFTSLSLSENVENPDIDGNVAMFTIPASAVIATVVFSEKSDPSISVTDGEDHPVSALNFGTTLKMDDDVPAAKTFVIAGANLTSALTVESSEPSLYAVSYAEGALTPDANKEVEATITITPQAGITSTAGTKSADITISDGGLASSVVVTASMTVQQTYTVNWYVNGNPTPARTQTDVVGTDLTEIPSNFSGVTDCSDKVFRGWTETANYSHDTDAPGDLITSTTGMKITAANKDYYAVFADKEGEDSNSWDLVTSASSLQENDIITLTSTCTYNYSSTAYYDTVAYAGKNNTLGAVASIGITNNKIRTVKSGSISEVKLVGGSSSGKWKLYDIAAEEYLNDANKAISYEESGDDVTIAISDGVATITDGDYTLQYNPNNNAGDYTKARFAYYSSTQKAIQIYKKTVTSATYSNFVTECPHVARVILSAATVSNGSISFAKNETAITSIVTEGESAVTVDVVVASHDAGYGLSTVELSGVDGASYSNGVITIPANAEGTLVATATFAQANYSVTLVQYPANAGATLSENITNVHYNVEQTISTTEPAGYAFDGWYLFDASTFDAENIDWSEDLSSEIFTGTYDKQDLELTAHFLMPEKDIVALANFDKVYTVDEFAALTKTNNTGYVVEGLICQINGFYSSKYISYLISIDGTTTGDKVLLYNGLGLDKAEFSGASDLSIGDKVRVYGKWNSSNSRLDNSYQLTYQAVDLASLAIVGTPSVTAYDAGQNFDKTGLSLTATYNTGYVVTNYTGTTITSDYDEGVATFSGNGNVTVTVSAQEENAAHETISTSREITVSVSNAVLDYAELASGYQTEFWAKEQYKEPKLNAYLNDVPATVLANVIGVTNTTGLDMSVAGDKSVVITYTRKASQSADVEYNFTVKPVVVDVDHAHSVATAREIIDVDKTDGEDLDLELAATKTHVIGIVKSVTALSGNNEGKYTIVIKDQTDAAKEMTLYQVTLNGVSSVEENDLIKAYGNLYYHSQSSKYEINTGGEIVWKQPKVSITIANQTLEIDQTLTIADVATIDPAAATVEYNIVANDDNCITLSAGVINAIAEGTATVSISAAHDGYLANSKTFTVTVKPAAVHTNVVLYAEYDGEYFALNNEGKATQIDVLGGKVVVANEATKNKIVWDRAELEGVATFYNVTAEKYLNGSNSTTLGVAASEGTYTSWTWKEAGYYTSKPDASTIRTFLYRASANNGFMNYAQSNKNTDDYADYTVIYTGEVVIGAIETIRENVSEGRYGTICLPDGCKLLNGTLYAVAYYGETSQKIFFDEVLNGQMEAGTPYIFLPNAGETELKGIYTDDANADAGSANGLVGYLGDVEDDVPVGKYILNNNQYWRVEVPGTAKVLPNRAYIDLDGISRKEAALAPGRRRVSMNVNNGSQLPTDIEGVEVNNAPRKVMIDGQIYIIRGEKRYDVRGQLVK